MQRAKKRLGSRRPGTRRRPPLRILVADDHPVVLQGVRSLLELRGLEVVAEATDGRQAVQLARELHPDVAVIDVVMPVMDGASAAGAIARGMPDVGLILLTGFPAELTVRKALELGVRGLVLKTELAEDLVLAVWEVARGATYVSPTYSRMIVDLCRSEVGPPRQSLSPREREVLSLIAEGWTTKEVAARLGIAVKTADGYRESIAEKLQVHGTAGLVRYAIRTGLTTA